MVYTRVYLNHNTALHLYPNTHKQVTGSCVHVLVHEIQNGKPESSKGGQGEERREVLEENLEKRHMPS